jgi:hypothetical protein
MPAPPPLSEPAIVSATGIGEGRVIDKPNYYKPRAIRPSVIRRKKPLAEPILACGELLEFCGKVRGELGKD